MWKSPWKSLKTGLVSFSDPTKDSRRSTKSAIPSQRFTNPSFYKLFECADCAWQKNYKMVESNTSKSCEGNVTKATADESRRRDFREWRKMRRLLTLASGFHLTPSSPKSGEPNSERAILCKLVDLETFPSFELRTFCIPLSSDVYWGFIWFPEKQELHQAMPSKSSHKKSIINAVDWVICIFFQVNKIFQKFTIQMIIQWKLYSAF